MVCDIASDDLSLISTECVYAFSPPWKESSVQIWLVCHQLYVVMLSNFILDAVFELVAALWYSRILCHNVGAILGDRPLVHEA